MDIAVVPPLGVEMGVYLAEDMDFYNNDNNISSSHVTVQRMLEEYLVHIKEDDPLLLLKKTWARRMHISHVTFVHRPACLSAHKNRHRL